MFLLVFKIPLVIAFTVNRTAYFSLGDYLKLLVQLMLSLHFIPSVKPCNFDLGLVSCGFIAAMMVLGWKYTYVVDEMGHLFTFFMILSSFSSSKSSPASSEHDINKID